MHRQRISEPKQGVVLLNMRSHVHEGIQGRHDTSDQWSAKEAPHSNVTSIGMVSEYCTEAEDSQLNNTLKHRSS